MQTFVAYSCVANLFPLIQSHVLLNRLTMKHFLSVLLVVLLSVALAQGWLCKPLHVRHSFSPLVSVVTVYPEGTFVSYQGGGADFRCYFLPLHIGRITRVQWIVNGSLLETFGFDNAETDFNSFANGIGVLLFSNLTQNFNNTRIQCRAHFERMPTMTSTEATILLLQGASSTWDSRLAPGLPL